jgi:hypothetical protein
MSYPAFGVTNRRAPNSSCKFDKENENENEKTVLRMFRYVSNNTLSITWENTYKVATLGDYF